LESAASAEVLREKLQAVRGSVAATRERLAKAKSRAEQLAKDRTGEEQLAAATRIKGDMQRMRARLEAFKKEAVIGHDAAQEEDEL
jgi:hypothetical protein